MSRRLNVHVEDEVAAYFDRIKEETGKTFNVIIKDLIHHECSTDIRPEQLFAFLGTTPEETTYMLDTRKTLNIDLAQEMRIGLLARLRSLEAATQQLKKIDLDNPEHRMRRKGAGEIVLQQVVARLMSENDATSEESEKVYITGKLLVRVAHCGKEVVAQFQHRHVDMLATHHAKHGWSDIQQGTHHNRFKSEKYRQLVAEYASAETE